MRRERDRVANRKKEAAAAKAAAIPLGRACWRSFPGPQEEFILSPNLGGVLGILRVSLICKLLPGWVFARSQRALR
jgi:hypothetical protein